MNLATYQSYLYGHRDKLLEAITPDAFNILDDVRTVLSMHQIYIDKKSTSKRETAKQIVDILIHHGDNNTNVKNMHLQGKAVPGFY